MRQISDDTQEIPEEVMKHYDFKKEKENELSQNSEVKDVSELSSSSTHSQISHGTVGTPKDKSRPEYFPYHSWLGLPCLPPPHRLTVVNYSLLFSRNVSL